MPAGNIVSVQTERRCLTNLACLRYLAGMAHETNELGHYLAQARKKLQLSLRAVQAETDVSNAYLSQLETGKIKTPSPTVLHTLALRYDLGYSHLLKLAGYPVPDKDADEVVDTTRDLAARLGGVSPEEEDALIEFLSLIRKRTGGGS